ncbi:magnesium transporter, partial [Methylobacterium radiotolerans]
GQPDEPGDEEAHQLGRDHRRPHRRHRVLRAERAILETHVSIQGNRMNLVMKKLTSWAAIIAVPTAVTGFFGQNVP